MPTLGHRRNIADSDEIAVLADHKYLMHFAVDRPMRLAKLSVKVDGLAPGGTGDGQPLAGVVYSPSGNLVAQSEESVVPIGSELHWHDLRFDNVPGGVLLAAGDYQFGIIAGGPASARIARVNGVGRRSSGGDIFGAVTTTTSEKVTLPSASLKVPSTANFDTEGQIEVEGQVLSYTGKEATKFTGVTGGVGAVESGAEVSQRGAAAKVNQPEAPMGDGRANLAINPSFESNTTGWSLGTTGYTSTSITREAAPAPVKALGTDFAARVKGTHEATTTERRLGAETASGTGGMPVLPSTKYTASLYVYGIDMPVGVSGSNFWLSIVWYTAAGATITTSTATPPTIAKEVLTRLTLTAEAPSNAAFAKVQLLGISATSGDTLDYWFDDVLFEQAASAGTYFPTNAQVAAGQITWAGAANNSKSAINEGEYRVFATYFEEPETPAITDIQIGRYPFSQAQAILGSEPPVSGSSKVASCSWHGTLVSPERGSFVLVQQNGRFSDLVGERVRVATFLGDSVYAYVLGEAELDPEDDLSLTRRLFMELGPLSADALNVRVEILSSEEEGV